MTPERLFHDPEPRDWNRELISAPLVTTYSLKALIDSPQFHQRLVLPSGRTVSYTTCGSKTGSLALYFYGLGGSSRQIASMHAQAVRLDLKLLSIDRPGTGYTDPYKSPSLSSRKKEKNRTKLTGNGGQNLSQKNVGAGAMLDEEEDEVDDTVATALGSNDEGTSNQGDSELSEGTRKSSRRRRWILKSGGEKSKDGKKSRKVNKRVIHTCLETLAVVDQLYPGARFGMMGHSCGIYYIMQMLQLCPERIQRGPITLLTPWVPFNECPETTSRSFKFLKHIPRGVVWAVTSSINHLGSVILSSTNAISGSLSNKTLAADNATEASVLDHSGASSNGNANGNGNGTKTKRPSSSSSSNNTRDRRKKQGRSKDRSTTGSDDDGTINFERRPVDPFVLQFSEAFDKILLPALVQDMNRQHSNGYNSEIQMCISDVGFDLSDVILPDGVTINAYCGHLDNMVPIEAAREMGAKCGWDIHEFKFSGHGGPRMYMYAMEDYALEIQAIERARTDKEQRFSEKSVYSYHL
ncbi:hypothetical protein K457DRAFT_22840 [Linnemannia elongata AG-77]|uniref:AB hydrolase-1 domain-containing protein n=1 Tax=Linnemannia elongata AG-77 TaxID=1314771 RepID=A0A197JMN9_9FUNG|nr:hypothetical protein K457DRAFT_22840 [Linnemannia elongata AG-77]